MEHIKVYCLRLNARNNWPTQAHKIQLATFSLHCLISYTPLLVM